MDLTPSFLGVKLTIFEGEYGKYFLVLFIIVCGSMCFTCNIIWEYLIFIVLNKTCGKDEEEDSDYELDSEEDSS